jgi:signal transduction histidine kinase
MEAREPPDERQRLAALHEYRLLGAAAAETAIAGELGAVVQLTAMVAGVATNPWVSGRLASIRFYVAVPLLTPEGYPLGALCAFGEEPRDLTGEQADRLKDLAERMLRLITSLLSYAQAGNAPCHHERADLGELVEQAITDLRGQLDGAAIVVPADLPVLDADPVLIRQLLQNLIGNALKYRRADRPSRIEIGAAREAGEWRITIADNGRGIPAAQRRRVFDMFTQVDPSARTGHGVGLSTCQRIVDRHGGRIGVRETPGGGTTVIFTLPATEMALEDLAVPR